jgi:predicted dehydrogenase
MPTHPTPNPLRLAIVGCGAVAREYHLPVLMQLTHLVRVTVLCDKIAKNTRLTNKQYGLDALETSDLAALAGRADAALVCTPPRSHAPVCVQLLEQGLDVLCEKPLATSLEDAERMVATAARTGRLLAVGLVMRLHPNNHVLRKLLQDELLGDVAEVVAEFGAPLDWTMTNAVYYSRQSTRGGVFFDSGVHVVDRVVWLLGDVEVADFEDDSFGGVESNAVLHGQITLPSGPVPLRMAFSWTHTLNNSIRLVGRNAIAEAPLGNPNEVMITRAVGGEPMNLILRSPTSDPRPFGPYYRQIEDFVEAAQRQRVSVAAAATALPALRVIEAGYARRRPMAQPWVTA